MAAAQGEYILPIFPFLFWRKIGFGFTYYSYKLRVPYSCGVVLVFLFWREIVFGVMYVLNVQYSCAGLPGGTNFFWLPSPSRIIAWAGGTFVTVVLLCQFFVLAGNRFWLYILLCTLSAIQLWCCVSFLVLCTYLMYNTVVWLWYFFCCGGKVNFVRTFLLNPNFLLVHRKFSSRTYAIIPQKY